MRDMCWAYDDLLVVIYIYAKYLMSSQIHDHEYLV